MAVAESLMDYKMIDSSKIESLEDSHATVRRKERSSRLKSNVSYVTVHIGHGIVQRGRRSVP